MRESEKKNPPAGKGSIRIIPGFHVSHGQRQQGGGCNHYNNHSGNPFLRRTGLQGNQRKAGEKMGYKVCPYCGANLDPGERCDCRDEVATSQQENVRGGKGLNKHNDIRGDEKEEHYNE